MRKWVFLSVFTIMSALAHGQDIGNPQTITAGVQFRPIFPADFLNTGDQQTQNSDFSVLVSPKFGFSAGMVVRYGFHKRFALETGLNFVQRNYDLTINRDSLSAAGAYSSSTDFTIIGYEHPIKLLVFIRLSERFYMNAAAGFQFTFFPSDIFTTDQGTDTTGQHFKHSSLRLGFDGKPGPDGFIHGGAIANLGWEYRTKKSGYFYLGATYQLPVADIYRSKFQYREDNYASQVQGIQLKGSYLTFDISYFFDPMPIVRHEKKKNRRKKKDSGQQQ